MKSVLGRAGSRVVIEMVQFVEVKVVVQGEACMEVGEPKKYSRTMKDERAMLVGHRCPIDVRCVHVAEEKRAVGGS